MSRRWRHLAGRLGIGAMLALVPAGSAHAEMALVEAGQNPCPILVAEQAAPLERVAAEELAKYLKRISGGEFGVKAAPATLPERAILVGAVATTAPRELGEDGFLIRTEGQHLHIVGGSPRGTLYGAYAFLESALGCKWWSHSEEDIPDSPTLRIGKLDIQEKPAFI